MQKQQDVPKVPFSYQFSPKKRPELKLEITNLPKDRVDEVALNMAQVFDEYEPVISMTPFDTQYFSQHFCKGLALKGIREGVDFTCFNRENGEWVASIFNEDTFTE